MKFSDKETIVHAAGLNVADTEEWFAKYQIHRSSSNQRGYNTELSFADYLTKATTGGLTDPNQIGRCKGQFVLGRVGDVGNYTNESCRFIPVEQNHHERYENGMHIEGFQRRFDSMVGQTKENNERVRKSAETRTGRTKETNEGHARQAAALAKSFTIIAPDGTVYTGNNVADFCKEHGLGVFNIYNVFAGRAAHHKGWTGHYVD